MSPSFNSVIEKKVCILNRKEIIADLNDTSNISWTLKKNLTNYLKSAIFEIACIYSTNNLDHLS